MMLPEGHGLYPGHPNLDGYVRFLNLSTGVLLGVHLPLFHDHIVLDSVDGLLLLLHHRGRDHGTTDIRLLHPFTGNIAEFPPLLSILPQMDTHYRNMTDFSVFLRGVCAAVTISAPAAAAAAGAITVMIALDLRRRVAHATSGDQRWNLSAWELPSLLASTASFQGKLYTVSPSSAEKNIVRIRQIDPPPPNSESLQPPRMIAECPLDNTIGAFVHMVECGLDLLLIGFNESSSTHLVVYRVADLVTGRIVPVESIGDHHALLLGERSMCVSPNKGLLPSVLGKHLVPKTHNPQTERRRPLRRAERRIEQYHLHTGTWSPAIDEEIPLASPYMLLHHIYTCCFRSYWNKGLMFHIAIRPDWSVKPNQWG